MIAGEVIQPRRTFVDLYAVLLDYLECHLLSDCSDSVIFLLLLTIARIGVLLFHICAGSGKLRPAATSSPRHPDDSAQVIFPECLELATLFQSPVRSGLERRTPMRGRRGSLLHSDVLGQKFLRPVELRPLLQVLLV